jgi:hypothetical protein
MVHPHLLQHHSSLLMVVADAVVAGLMVRLRQVQLERLVEAEVVV